MHNYSRLKVDELKIRYNEECGKEWAGLSSEALSLNMYGSSGHISQFLEMGHKYVNKFIDGLFETEKVALFHEQPELSESYFVALNREILEFVKSEYETIRTEALENFRSNNDIIIPRIQQYESSTRESVNNRVKLLQEELRLEILRPSSKPTIYVCGDVGVVNIGTIYSSVQVKIEKLKESNQTELVNALKLLIEIINNSTLKNEDKQEQMENVNLLVEQCEIPKEKRNCGLIKAAERFLSAAANLTTIWEKVGPMIMKFLGVC